MANKRIPLVSGEFYHVYNRGIAHQPTFLDKSDYKQGLLSLSYYRNYKIPMSLSRFKEQSIEKRWEIIQGLEIAENLLIKIVSFAFMPNHFHFLLYQTKENGISKFLNNFTNSYTRYFNTRHERVGPVYQGIFKAVRIETNEQLLHVSRYIHLNPVVSCIIKESELFSYPWSSLPNYVENNRSSLIWSDPILEQFSTIDEYSKFILDHVDYARKLEEIKHLVIE